MPAKVLVPAARPQMTDKELIAFLNKKGISLDMKAHPIWIVGIRGYYLNTMGKPGKNDRGLYDDALFIYSEPIYAAYNANTDPAVRRPGKGYGASKGIAKLKAGIWYVHKLDFHRSSYRSPYLALCQRGRSVTVIRDGVAADYPDTGEFGINIHCGGFNSVSSLGCQTIYPTQWKEFIGVVKDLAIDFFNDNWNKTYIPYVLVEQ